jgi:tetratricopeptide (TPR) repeat protein
VAEEPLLLGSDFLEFTPTSSAPVEIPEVEAPMTAPAAGAELPGGDGFDLASELGDLFGAQPAVAAQAPSAPGTDLGDASLADIFREFQRGVDKQLGKEDYETRYNLGIAYKEMGLVDEAIAEFQLAAKDEARLLECASMLGICFLEKGMSKLAVKWFEKGLGAPGRSEEEYQGLRYDLASALEQAGETGRALALFTELYGQDASFRDVADKLRQLGDGP